MSQFIFWLRGTRLGATCWRRVRSKYQHRLWTLCGNNAGIESISSFYLYNQNGTWPSRWTEIDLEFTPGFTGVGKVVDPNHPHSLAQGICYNNTTSDSLPTSQQCHVKLFLTGKAGTALSFNTFNIRSIDGEPYTHTNDQVFMPSKNGDEIFNHFHTYYFYYLPNGIYWTQDLPEVNLTLQPPTQLPKPIFVKKDFSIVEKNPNWNPAQNLAFQAFWYDSLPLSPKNSNGKIVSTGALMNLSMNLWDGTNTDPTHQQDWGGNVPPAIGANSAYKYVAYYPLLNNVSSVGNDPTQLSYGRAVVFSDFTTPHGRFLFNGKETTFTGLWHVYNIGYIWPLGQLDERNIYCGSGQLMLKISATYPDPRNNYDPLKNCPWLNQN